MILLVVVAAVILLLAAAGLLLGVRQRRSDAAARAQVVPEPAELTQVGGQDMSWNDLVVARLKAHYPGFDGSINDLLARFKRDHP